MSTDYGRDPDVVARGDLNELAKALDVDPKHHTWDELLDKVRGYVRENRTIATELVTDHRRELSHALGYTTDEAGLESWAGLLQIVASVQKRDLKAQTFGHRVRNALGVEAHTSDELCLEYIAARTNKGEEHRHEKAVARWLIAEQKAIAEWLLAEVTQARNYYQKSAEDNLDELLRVTGELDKARAEPDATNPVHLDFAAEIVNSAALPKGVQYTDSFGVVNDLRLLRDRYEREQAEKDKRDALVDQVQELIIDALESTPIASYPPTRPIARALVEAFDITPKAGA